MLGYAKPDDESIVDEYEYPFDLYPYYKGVFEIINTDKQFGILRGNQIGYYSLEVDLIGEEMKLHRQITLKMLFL